LTTLLLVAGLTLSTCGEAADPTQIVEPSPGVSETLTPLPTPTPAASPTPAPTPRPLVFIEADEGLYRSELFGVSLEIPSGWTVVESSDADIRLLHIEAPDGVADIFLDWEFLGEGDELEFAAEELRDLLWEVFELEGTNATSSGWFEPLIDGTPAWHHEILAFDFGGYGLLIETTTVEAGGKAFGLVVISAISRSAGLNRDIIQVQDGFRFHPPRPYGVDRETSIFFASGEPETLDPAKWRYSADSVIGDLYSGLVRMGTDLQIIPDLAERWEVSPDGTMYTFHLRRNVAFHSGRSFDAQDVAFSLERALDPEIESDTALTYLNDIEGAEEFAAGEAEAIAGISVLDNHTVELRLVGPRAYFLHKLAYPVSWIVDRETVDEIETNPIGTGPFMMMKHDEDELMILGRNPRYHLGFVPLEYVVYLLYPGYSLRLYESDEIDFISIDEDLLDRASDENDPLFGTVHESVGLCTTYVLFDSSRPPFSDPLVRRAFAEVVDRDRLNEVVFEGKGVMAAGLYPPGMPGYTPEVVPLETNLEGAVESLGASRYGDSTNLPTITFTMGGAGSGIPASDALLVESWEQTFGIDIQVEQLDSDSFYPEIYAGNHGNILRLSWCADYPDPQNFADILFHSESQNNHGGYRNAEIDRLLEQARGEPDFDQRMVLYRSIEQVLVDDVAAVFLWHARPYYIVHKPQIEGFIATPVGVAQVMNFWLDHSQ
jgi:oligopeptide transport system substrate-binding protein